MRTRIACAELVTDVGVPFNTASAVMSVAPNRTPDTRPLAETVARVVSADDHSNVTPLVTVVLPDFAVAASWRVPFKKTVESPLTTTEVIVRGPPPPPSPPPQSTIRRTPKTSKPKRLMAAPRCLRIDDHGSRHARMIAAVVGKPTGRAEVALEGLAGSQLSAIPHRCGTIFGRRMICHVIVSPSHVLTGRNRDGRRRE